MSRISTRGPNSSLNFDLLDIQQLHHGSREPVNFLVSELLRPDILAMHMAFVKNQGAVSNFGSLEHQQKRSDRRRDPRGGDGPFGTVVQDNDLDIGSGPHDDVHIRYQRIIINGIRSLQSERSKRTFARMKSTNLAQVYTQ